MVKPFTTFLAENKPRYTAAQLTGRLTSGAGRGRGTVYHAVPLVYNGVREEISSWGRALCGAQPGRRSGSGFVEPLVSEQPITCPRCLLRLATVELITLK